jgi:4-hydroxy-4-methyl-2-oxoglutarate aldolase
MKYYATTAVNDAMKQTGTMDPGIKTVTPGLKLIGTAYTVKCKPGSIITCHKALGEVPRGSVLVVDGQVNPNGALWGGLMSAEAIEKGVKGIIVDGAVRDTNTIQQLGFPTFSRYVTPSVGSNRAVGTTGDTIVCGGVVVNTGDLIIADDDGVVVIPKDRVEEILEKADAVELKEAGILEKVKQGGHIADILGISALIQEAEKQAEAEKVTNK